MILFHLLTLLSGVFSLNWQTSKLLAEGTYPSCAKSSLGGFHIKLELTSPNDQVSYQRMHENGTFDSAIALENVFASNGNIVEIQDGSVFVTWENWPYGIEMEQAFAAFKKGGNSQWSVTDVTNFVYGQQPDGAAKYPLILPLGRNRETAIFIVWQANTLEFMYGLFDTKKEAWTPLKPIPHAPATSKYSVTGAAWNPYNGHVIKTYGRYNETTKKVHVLVRAFNGTNWEPERLVSDTMKSIEWPAVAANKLGEIITVWEDEKGKIWSAFHSQMGKWQTPIEVTDGSFPSITHIPTNEAFYMTFTSGTSSSRSILGMMFQNGTWSSQDIVSYGLPQEELATTSTVCADDLGNLLCIFEVNAANSVQSYFTTSKL